MRSKTCIYLLIQLYCVESILSQVNDYRYKENTNASLGEAVQFLRDYNRDAADMCNRVASSEWKFATNSTDYNKRRMREQQSLSTKFECLSWRKAVLFKVDQIPDFNIRRQLDRIQHQGRCGLNDDKYNELMHIVAIMKDNYNNAKICPYRGDTMNIMAQVDENLGQSSNYVTSFTGFCDLKLDPDLMRIMERSRSEPELRYTWIAWREKTGPPIKNSFMRYLDLANQAAELHGFKDAGAQMRSIYEDNDFFFTVQDLWAQVQPLYKQLFTFVRRGLVRKYGEFVVRRDGPIPTHLLGNMWGQNWRNILDLVKPGPQETPNMTGEMIRQGYTALKIFQSAEEFFTSLGMPPMSPEFWRNSMLQKPNDVYTQCTASAWDFCNNIDFRIKQCTQVTIEDFVNSHHEMTHIQYYMQYTSQPFIYREGPNPAFHEAIAHAIGLCVGGPVHLQRVGLLPNQVSTSSGNSLINIEYLLSVALDKLPFMAFSIALEKWRWYLFEKGPANMNARWWELNLRYQGIIPPAPRSQEHFDAGAKYHVVSDQDYIKYFVATILQFQIYSELCAAANHAGPLHTCDFYRSREAGRLLSDIMQQGAALSPSQLLKILSRGKISRMSADALLEFFRPLEAWLEQQNRDESLIGWNSNIDDVALFQSFVSSSIMVSPGEDFAGKVLILLSFIVQRLIT